MTAWYAYNFCTVAWIVAWIFYDSRAPIFDSRVVQALSQLRKDGFIVNEARGVFKITKTGLSEPKKG